MEKLAALEAEHQAAMAASRLQAEKSLAQAKERLAREQVRPLKFALKRVFGTVLQAVCDACNCIYNAWRVALCHIDDGIVRPCPCSKCCLCSAGPS